MTPEDRQLLTRLALTRRHSLEKDKWSASLRLDGRPWGRVEANGPRVNLYRDQSVPRQAFEPVFEQLRTIVRTSGTTFGHLLEATRVEGSLLEGFHKAGSPRPHFEPPAPEPRAASRTRNAASFDSMVERQRSKNEVTRHGGVETMRLFLWNEDQSEFQYSDWAFLPKDHWVLLVWGNGYTETRINKVEVNEQGFHIIRQPGADRALRSAIAMLEALDVES